MFCPKMAQIPQRQPISQNQPIDGFDSIVMNP